HQPYCAIPARGNQGLDLLATGLLETFDLGLGGLLGAGGQPQARRPVGAALLPLQNPAPTSTGELPRVIDDGGARPVQYPHLPWLLRFSLTLCARAPGGHAQRQVSLPAAAAALRGHGSQCGSISMA